MGSSRLSRRTSRAFLSAAAEDEEEDADEEDDDDELLVTSSSPSSRARFPPSLADPRVCRKEGVGGGTCVNMVRVRAAVPLFVRNVSHLPTGRHALKTLQIKLFLDLGVQDGLGHRLVALDPCFPRQTG